MGGDEQDINRINKGSKRETNLGPKPWKVDDFELKISWPILFFVTLNLIQGLIWIPDQARDDIVWTQVDNIGVVTVNLGEMS